MAKEKQKKTMKKKNYTWLWVFGGLLVVVALVIVFTSGHSKSTLPDTVTVQDAQNRFSEGAFLLDVREQSEWQEAHIDGAVLIPLGELSGRIAELPTDRDILVICRSGNRSAQARDLLRAAGMNRVTSVAGGMNAWKAAGLPVVSGN
jgi:rhodanese-related sulfurtransferase